MVPYRRFRLHNWRSRCAVVVRMCHQLLFEMLRHPVDNISIFSVHHGGDTEFASGIHDIENLVVMKPHGLVRHVQLHTRYSVFIDHPGKFIFNDLLGRVGDDNVECIIAVGLVLGEFVIVINDRNNTLVLLQLRSERNYCCCSASHSTPSAGVICVSDIVFAIWNHPVREGGPIDTIDVGVVYL